MGYFERKRKEMQAGKKLEIDRIAYGSVIGILERDSMEMMHEIIDVLVAHGVRLNLNPFAMEILMVRDPRNKVPTKLGFPSKMFGFFHRAVILKGEKKSRIRHNIDRLVFELRGKMIVGRYEHLLDHGFYNLHYRHGPVLTIKENPSESDVVNAQKAIDSLDVEKKRVFLEREVWGKWR